MCEMNLGGCTLDGDVRLVSKGRQFGCMVGVGRGSGASGCGQCLVVAF